MSVGNGLTTFLSQLNDVVGAVGTTTEQVKDSVNQIKLPSINTKSEFSLSNQTMLMFGAIVLAVFLIFKK